MVFQPKIDVMTYSDASVTGLGGYAAQIGELSATGSSSPGRQHEHSTHHVRRKQVWSTPINQQANNIRQSVEWVNRDKNEQADTLLRIEDANDYSTRPKEKKPEQLFYPTCIQLQGSNLCKRQL